MGFSVTATHVIFAVALLSAGTYAASKYWEVQAEVEDARRVFAQRADEVVHTNLTWVSTPDYNAGANRLTFTFKNTGSTVLDVSDFAFVIDGKWNNSFEGGWPKVGGTTTSDVLLPGENLEVRMRPITSSPSNLRVIAGNGVSLYWP